MNSGSLDELDIWISFVLEVMKNRKRAQSFG